MDILKPKIFLFGACDLQYSTHIDPIRREFRLPVTEYNTSNHDSLDFQTSWKPSFGSSLRSLYTPPNTIANRLYDTMYKMKNRKEFQYNCYREVAKFPYLQYFKENAGPRDILLINFSTELYTKIASGSEVFGMTPLVNRHINNPDDPLFWLYNEYISKREFQVPFDLVENLEETYELLKQFAIDVHDIFQNRVVLVNTHFTELALINDITVKKVNVPVNREIIYKQTRVMSDMLDHSYAQRSTDIFINKFHRWYKSDIPIVKYDGELFTDPFHKHGDAPFHLHKLSAYKVGLKILEALLKINKESAKENIHDTIYQHPRI
jgi:hypothetical protein